MLVFYLDTSAIVKRYRQETGTELLDELFGVHYPEDEFYTSFLSVLEFNSAILRLVKGGYLTEEFARETLARFQIDIGDDLFLLLPLESDAVTLAVDVVQKYMLRSNDAIHLATALLYLVESTNRDGIQVMVSGDTELVQASESSGMISLNPQNPDSLETLRQLRSTSAS